MSFTGPDRCEKLLIIPDAHAHPQYDNDRFDLLARLIDAERPDTIVCLGDFADMPALSGYDKGKRGFEGRRYVRDVESTRDALTRMHAGIGYGPELLMCLGNHEARIDRATSDNAELEGAISTEDLGYQEHGWKVFPFQAPVSVAGFSISHHFASGVGGRPIGGMNQAAAMARLLLTSAIVGHSHVFDMARRTRPDGSRVVCMSAGCFSHHEQATEGWCAATGHMWWHGVVLLDGAAKGDYGAMRCVTLDQMRVAYGAPVAAAAPAKRPSARRLWKGRAV